MCSLNDDYETYDNCESSSEIIFSEHQTCRSCNNNAKVVLRKKDKYCQDCFLTAEIHKFRAVLGKNKIMKPSDRVLVIFSGNHSSLALLHLLRCGVTEKHHKKLVFNINVLFIEEGILLNMDTQERTKIVEQVKQKTNVFEFPIFITSISESFIVSPKIDTVFNINTENDLKLNKLLDSVKSISCKEDLLHSLRKKLILNAAAQLNCNKIFTSEVGTDLAVKLLSYFSLGRGDQASFETGLCDTRDPNHLIIRPLKEFLRKEIVFYNFFNNLEPLILPTLTGKLQAKASIQKLTEKFIMGLQENFPHTIYTTFRIGEKLCTKSETSGNEVCLLCGNQIFCDTCNSYSAIDALHFSKNIANKIMPKCDNKQNCCGSCSSDEIIKKLDLQRTFCYGCRTVLNDMETMDYLPKHLLECAVYKTNIEKMREEISEFLINDSDMND